jgi:hypothetical protein
VRPIRNLTVALCDDDDDEYTMKPRRVILAVALLAWAISAAAQSPALQSTVQTREVLTNRSIVTLASAGFGEDFIIDLIAKSRTEFDTSVGGLESLAKQGMNERVIRAMLNPSAGLLPVAADQPALDTSGQAPQNGATAKFFGFFKKFHIGPRAPSQPNPRLIPGAGVIQIESVDLPRAIQGLVYSASIHVSVNGQCPSGNVGLHLASGSLPRGLRTTDDGLGGVPTEMGDFRFLIEARNTCASTTRAFQLLVTGHPILRATPERFEFTVLPDSVPDSQIALISSTWPGLAYTLSTPDGSWLTLRQAQGTTPEAGSAFTGDRATVTAIPRMLAPGVHRGTLIVSARDADPIKIEVTVTVGMPKSAPEILPWIATSSISPTPPLSTNPTLPAQPPQ